MATKTKITISKDGVCFDKKLIPINDSANMSYMFVNGARRELTLRWEGTDAESLLPIWEFSVFWPDDNTDVIQCRIVGYGVFEYAGRTLLRIHDSGVVQKAA